VLKHRLNGKRIYTHLTIIRDGKIDVEKQQSAQQTKFTKKLLWSDESTRQYVEDVIEHDGEEPVTKRTKITGESYTREEVKKDLMENVRVWSDYLKAYLHPKSIYETKDVIFQVDEFEMWKKGHTVFQSEQQRDDMTDNLHFYLEDCDQLQCFQMFTETANAWGAVAEDYIEFLHDEVGSKVSIVSLGCSQFVPNYNSDIAQANAIISTAFSLTTLAQYSHYIPTLSDPATQYVSSSYIASTFDTITTPYRRSGVADWLKVLQPYKAMSVSEMSSSLPLPIPFNTNMNEFFTKSDPLHQNELVRSFTPYIKRNMESPDPYAHIGVLRGVEQIPLYEQKAQQPEVSPLLKQLLLQMTGVERAPTNRGRYSDDEQDNSKGPYGGCNNVQEMMDRYMNLTRCMASSHLVLNQGMPVPYTWPDVLPSHLNENGHVVQEPTGEIVQSVPVLAHVQTTPLLANFIQTIVTEFDRVAIKRRPHQSLQFTSDELKERKEQLYNLLDAYEQ
jgi:hypothetical protein